jgi:hypothetical protein
MYLEYGGELLLIWTMDFITIEPMVLKIFKNLTL